MPIIDLSKNYKPNWYSNNRHLATIVPSMTRKIDNIQYVRERLTLADGDFLDLDWIKKANDKLLIITHGLEGNSNKQYVKGMAQEFSINGWDILAWNCRSCSGEMNIAPKLYHHGDIHDITEVIEHVLDKYKYSQIALGGYSMGGVINTKFVAKKAVLYSDFIKLNIAISTPFDLEACAHTLDRKANFVYKNKFMKSLMVKLSEKEKQYPGIIDKAGLSNIKSWAQFDEQYSAPFNGYNSRQELYANATINNWLEDIRVPTLLLNSVDDPMIPVESNPKQFAQSSDILTLALTPKGGHCGFGQRQSEKSFAESFSFAFANKILK
ncbi:MAG TPA: alpha/beta fold hydrolase [Saprospiraceae bacterium]|nr:alpha/beta fold hydrolase [Saprospiraceae bacterium]MCC6689193.1 alpha/beta fold hydrolase [Saprospiraceae bacterium]HMX81934.1 alpha/beta fold hydrolase [Saprospiraceae bacterium]HMX85610.1 alpha/beta fold hydrolase [Saprospiraceae bacterium]HMZ72061.1 alpha/beta fold hydrolase [Saprospiraceae bacterium]